MQNTLRLVTLLAWGLSIPAYAQAPTFSVPPIPGTETNNAAPAPAAAPSMPTNSAPAVPALPGLENLAAAAPKPEAEEPPAKSPDEVIKEVKDNAQAGVLASGATNDPTNPSQPMGAIPYNVAPPPLTLDGAPPPPLPALNLPVPQPLGLAATAIPEPVVEPKKTTPTWKDVLKPSYKPKETKFNYRRQVLPPTIYRTYYGPENRHLPTARTFESYDHAFILAAARNDVSGVRAMLNNGRRNANLVNAEGESVLLVALRHGALGTARLLIAYGADVNMSGSNGWSARDYANYWGDPELIRAVNGA